MESDEADETKHLFEIAEDKIITECDLVETHYISNEDCETETNDELICLEKSGNVWKKKEKWIYYKICFL